MRNDAEHSQLLAMRKERNAVENKLMGWLGESRLSSTYDIPARLVKLVGYNPVDLSKEQINQFALIRWTKHHAEVFEKLKMLNGPHGYTVYRAMLAKGKADA